eukprot:PhM_4_TR17221/c0_g2_i1/m.39475/K19750/DNAAF1, LRRC50, ODA7; dynein assembly factor 1, axonemal
MLTKKLILESCDKNGLYRTPTFNDKLYLHFKGLTDIANLEEYTAVRVLWLEGNCIRTITNLDAQTELRQLYLHQNMIEEISGLDHLAHLIGLNLSDNVIRTISGLSSLQALQTLQLKGNRLRTLEDVRGIADLGPSLSVLDLSGNEIEDPAIVDLLAAMPSLSCLYLHSNPVCAKVKPYRKTIVGRCEKLRYLDDRPVFDDERRTTNAWMRGGAAAESDERQTIRREEDEKRRRNHEWFQNLIREGRRERRAAQGEDAVTPSTSAEDTLSSGDDSSDDKDAHTEYYRVNYGAADANNSNNKNNKNARVLSSNVEKSAMSNKTVHFDPTAGATGIEEAARTSALQHGASAAAPESDAAVVAPTARLCAIEDIDDAEDEQPVEEVVNKVQPVDDDFWVPGN